MKKKGRPKSRIELLCANGNMLKILETVALVTVMGGDVPTSNSRDGSYPHVSLRTFFSSLSARAVTIEKVGNRVTHFKELFTHFIQNLSVSTLALYAHSLSDGRDGIPCDVVGFKELLTLCYYVDASGLEPEAAEQFNELANTLLEFVLQLDPTFSCPDNTVVTETVEAPIDPTPAAPTKLYGGKLSRVPDELPPVVSAPQSSPSAPAREPHANLLEQDPALGPPPIISDATVYEVPGAPTKLNGGHRRGAVSIDPDKLYSLLL